MIGPHQPQTNQRPSAKPARSSAPISSMTSRKVSSYSIRNRNVPPLSLPLPPHAVKIQGHLFENALLRLFECRHNERHTSPSHGTASVPFKRPPILGNADNFQANRTGGGHGRGVGGYGAGGVLRGFPRLLWWAVVVGRGPRPSCWPSKSNARRFRFRFRNVPQFDARGGGGGTAPPRPRSADLG